MEPKQTVPPRLSNGLATASLVLFTRNVLADSLDDLTGPIRGTLRDEPPFGARHAVVIFRDGSSRSVPDDPMQTWESLFGGDLNLTNRVLRP